MKRLWIPIALAAGLLYGCASTTYRAAGSEASVPPTLSPVPYLLQVELLSDLPDPYPVVSGPVETYERFRMTEAFREALGRYARAKSRPGSAQTATVKVRLAALTTTYREVGVAYRPRIGLGPRRLVPEGQVGALVSPARPASWRTAEAEWGDGGDLSIPEEIHKSAHLTGAVTVDAGGSMRVERPLDVQVTRVERWEDYDP
ncbi:MAG: hypothetical protein Kow0092_07330 [Deferrisomatales bacterium]